MMRIMLFLLTIAVAGCTEGTRVRGADARSSPAMNATPEQIDAGRQIVELQCVSCHAVRSSDESHNPRAPALRTLAERYPVTGLEEAFALGIMVGHPGMPEFRLDRDQIKAILAYLESIQTRRGAGLDPNKLDAVRLRGAVGHM